MNTIFVLIMVLGGATTQSGWTTIQAEFSSWESCEAARKHIIANMAQSNRHNDASHIKSQGCHKK